MGSITVTSLGKAYKQYANRWSRLIDWFLPAAASRSRRHWVLKDINFTVEPGEAVGIVGANGAGKSTLLKLIAATTVPTTGQIRITGRVVALLELGMGFHADFTGRQNVVMAGQLLGISSSDLHRLMPEIEAFAEVGDYIDQPVRAYSSGMQMRLAFSVATAIRPDVLIVDEALSVGDAYFQHKSFDRIRAFRQQGTTLLLVSHDKIAIQSICDRAILLEKGQKVMEGLPEAVMDYYNARLTQQEHNRVSQSILPAGRTQTISGSGHATIEEVSLENENGQTAEVVKVGEALALKVRASVHQAMDELVLGFMIKDRAGQPVFGTNTYHLDRVIASPAPGSQYTFVLRFDANLGQGSYSVAIALHSKDTHVLENYEWRDLALVFDVINVDKPTFVGTNWLPVVLDIRS